MAKRYSRSAMLAAALAAVPLVASVQSASAQYRIDTGHDNDASNRIGSGGYNSSHDWTQPSFGASNNNIVSGNVTGLNYFHGGPYQYFNPYDLQLNTESAASDTLNAEAAPVNYGQRSTGAPLAQSFYSTTIVNTPPPPGSVVTTSNNVGYLPAPPQIQQPSDTRLGTITSVPNAALDPTPGELDLPGPVDTSGNPMLTTMSPLYGMRDWSVADPSDMYFLSRYSNLGFGAGVGGGARLDAATVQKMRNELSATVVQGSALAQRDQSTAPGGPSDNAGLPGANALASPNTAGGPAGTAPGAGGQAAPGSVGSANLTDQQQLDRPVGSPGSSALAQAPLGVNLDTQSLSSDTSTHQGQRQELLDVQLPPPGQQSSQLQTLEDRERSLQSQSHQTMTDEQAARIYNQERALRTKIAQQSAPANGLGGETGNASAAGGGTAAESPGGYGAGSSPTANPPLAGVAAKPPAGATLNPMLKPIAAQPGKAGSSALEPYVITSLATGIRAPGLATLMRTAEDQMRAGKFNNALDSYDSAQQVAPNNPFIRLGRGFAELGASYYGRAEGDIRRAIAAEPALLAGKYDLKGFLGEDRLNFVNSDLQDIYRSEKTSEQAAFLLAFIAHNQGQDEQAAQYLNAAEQRANHNDPVVALMRQNWGLPLNK